MALNEGGKSLLLWVHTLKGLLESVSNCLKDLSNTSSEILALQFEEPVPSDANKWEQLYEALENFRFRAMVEI